jgi:hypothetical protein
LSKQFHLKDCPEYLHFGSEFEVVVVVHTLGRHHRKLLKADTKAAFVDWLVPASHQIEECSFDQVKGRLLSGNYPELAAFLLNPWLLAKVGRVEDIRFLNLDFSLIFRPPFSVLEQKIVWVDEAQISRYSP